MRRARSKVIWRGMRALQPVFPGQASLMVVVAIHVPRRGRGLAADAAAVGRPLAAERRTVKLRVDLLVDRVGVIAQRPSMSRYAPLRATPPAAFPGTLLLHPRIPCPTRTRPVARRHGEEAR